MAGALAVDGARAGVAQLEQIEAGKQMFAAAEQHGTKPLGASRRPGAPSHSPPIPVGIRYRRWQSLGMHRRSPLDRDPCAAIARHPASPPPSALPGVVGAQRGGASDSLGPLPRWAEGVLLPGASLSHSELPVDFYLQPSAPEDEPFLRKLNQLAYEPVVVAQFGSWDPIKQREFFDAKWRTQTYSIIVANALPIGAVSSIRSEDAVTLLELLILPAHQNAGVGTRVVQQLQDEARSKQVPLLLQVLHLNRARRLYEQLGFRIIESTETHYRMRWASDRTN
jgi:GNAT superfamily N-acetyltransferase